MEIWAHREWIQLKLHGSWVKAEQDLAPQQIYRVPNMHSSQSWRGNQSASSTRKHCFALRGQSVAGDLGLCDSVHPELWRPTRHGREGDLQHHLPKVSGPAVSTNVLVLQHPLTTGGGEGGDGLTVHF